MLQLIQSNLLKRPGLGIEAYNGHAAVPAEGCIDELSEDYHSLSRPILAGKMSALLRRYIADVLGLLGVHP